MEYRLEILSRTGGQTAVAEVKANGALVGGSLHLEYEYDGSNYTLTVARDKMEQKRRGGVNLDTTFISGQTTTAKLFGGGGAGGFPVCTRKLSVEFDGDDVYAECEFSFGGDSDITILTVRAVAVGGRKFS